MEPDLLRVAREAVASHDWQAAFDAGTSGRFDDPALDGARLDVVADAAWWLGRLDDCIAAREEAYLRFDEVGDPRRSGRCAVWLYEHHAMAAHPAIAGGWLRRARRALRDDQECEAYGALQLREAEQAHGGGELDTALELATGVVDLGRRLRSPDLEAQALQTRGRVLIERGEIDEGMGHLDEAMLFAIEGRLAPYSTGKVYCSLISACEELGDLDRASEWTEATMRWAAQHPFAIFPGICRVHRAVVLKRRGDLEGAGREAEIACVELRQSHVANSAAAFAEVGDIRRRLGQLEEAEQAFDRSRELSGQPCGGLALVRLAQGRTESAMALITQCLREAGTNPLARSRLLPTFVHVAVAVGDVTAARNAQESLEEIGTTLDTPMLRATVLSSRGRLELAMADAGEVDMEVAAGTLRQAAEHWTALEVPYEVATARTLLGRALQALGDVAGAEESFAVASGLFDRIGACADTNERPEEAPVALPDGLTEREVEVLRLVAAGLTNNEMAAELYLSVKTVSRHLSNIFTKIGVSSRSAATAYAFERGLVESGRA